MRGAAKSVQLSINRPGIAVVTALVWADSPTRIRYNGADAVVVDLFGQTGNTGAARRGIELRGFHGWRQRIRMQRRRGGRRARKERERERERERDGNGERRARRRDERADGTRARSGEGMIKGRGHAY